MPLRSAILSDAAAIAALHAASWRLTLRGILTDEYLDRDVLAERTAVWEGQLRNPPPRQLVLVAYDEDALMGFACTRVRDDPVWGGSLENIHVSAQAHRKGIGSQLLRAVAGHCASPPPATGLYLWVLQANREAQKFYHALGGKNVGTGMWNAPDGTDVARFRFAWTARELPLGS